MLYNFLKVILRYIFRSKFFTIVNVAGLSIGIACSIVIYLYIRHELTFDKFHKDRDSIYRVTRKSQINGMPYDIGVTSGPFKQALLTDFSNQIDDATRALPGNALIQFGDKSFLEDRVLLGDKNFFEFFSYPLAAGDPAYVLSQPNNVVLTRSLAEKYFGHENPVGKTIRLDDQYDLVVTGVMAEVPGNTHLQFDLIASIDLLETEEWFHEWWNNSLYTYVKVPEQSNVAYLNEKFASFMDKYFGDDFARVGNRIDLQLEPLNEIYFNYDTRYETNVAHGDEKYVFIFGSIGVLLILLASINYTNLATAQASKRAKEVGIRKTLGSSKAKIAFQFLSESFVLCFISILIALGITQLAVPFFQSSFGIQLASLYTDSYLLYFLGGLLLAITLFSGGYPSFFLASFKPVKVLKGEVKGEWSYLFLRKSLVVAQFGISIFMIISTLLIGKQLKFMQEKDLGFDRDQLMVISINNQTVGEQREAFKTTVLAQKDVKHASFMTGHPGGFYDASTVRVEGSEETMRMRTLWTDEDFITTMGITMTKGRSFSKEFPSDREHAVMLNETAIRQLGWTPEDAIGKHVMLSQFDSVYKQVVGVVEDYHFISLKEKIEPLIISYGTRGRLAVKLSGGDIHHAVKDIEEIWNGFGSGFPMEWSFLDETVNHLYRKEIVQSRLFSLFSVISVAIACLGILGLTSYMAAQRKKEIGIRKILGASAEQLSLLLMKDVLLLVLISNLIAVPLGYLAMKEWLEGFAYKTPIQPLAFLYGALLVFGVAVLITGLRALKTATENPVTALRTE